MSEPDRTLYRSRLIVWWAIWGAILCGLCGIYFALGRGPLPAATPDLPLLQLIPLVPLFISVVVRWLVLPRFDDMRRAMVMFIIGLALAEGCGIMGIFLGGVYRDDLFLLGVFGILQYIPIFTRRYREPRPQGFIPNN